MSYISAHVLDTMAGTPAQGITVRLQHTAGEEIAAAVTDSDGRVGDLGPETLDPGDYRIIFETGEYFSSRRRATFFPRVTVDFTVEHGEAHYHVPLLLSPFAFSTYRGS